MVRSLAALVVAGIGASAFAEAVDVGGGALEKDRPAEVAQTVRSVVEPFASGQRTFDRGWEFRLKDFAVNFNKVGIGAGGNNNGITTLLGETNGWRRVDIPHDWMLAMPVAQSGRNGFRAVGRSHPANSVGWYRKRFIVPEKVETRPCVWLQFDGIYRDAQFWVNGVYLGRNDSGYIGCRFDMTDLIEYGGATNTVAVRVDASRGEGWWYEGAGIYRHVKLIVKNPDHIRPDGILFRTLKIADGRATVSAEAEVEGEGRVAFELDGVAFEETLEIENPKLWSPDAPHLHTLVARLVGADGRVKDEVSLKVGIRQFVFDANRGLLVNGVPTKVLPWRHGVRGRGRARRAARLPREAPEGNGRERRPHLPQPADAGVPRRLRPRRHSRHGRDAPVRVDRRGAFAVPPARPPRPQPCLRRGLVDWKRGTQRAGA